jgi:hypothetical protein
MLNYLIAVGFQLDELLCAILFGVMDTTISLHVALEAKAGKKWACLFCKFLSWLVQRDHCQDQLDNVPMQLDNYIRALIGLLLLAALIVIVFLALWHFEVVVALYIWNEIAKLL